MDYYFKKNGIASLTLKAEANAIEIEFFKELFSGDVEFERISSTNHSDEIIIKRKVIAPVTVVTPA